MTCHYCSGDKLERGVWKNDTVYLWVCQECHKTTSVPIAEKCVDCNTDITFLYDPGWNETPFCDSCSSKRIKNAFDDPDFQAALKEELLKKMPLKGFECQKPE